MDLKRTNVLLESVKKELANPARRSSRYIGEATDSVDPVLAQKIARALTSGRAKYRYGGADRVLKNIEQWGMDQTFDIHGTHGMAQLGVGLEPGKIGGYGFNPKNMTAGDIEMAMKEMADCLQVARAVWAIVKAG
jgi:hypothetical protein